MSFRWWLEVFPDGPPTLYLAVLLWAYGVPPGHRRPRPDETRPIEVVTSRVL